MVAHIMEHPVLDLRALRVTAYRASLLDAEEVAAWALPGTPLALALESDGLLDSGFPTHLGGCWLQGRELDPQQLHITMGDSDVF